MIKKIIPSTLIGRSIIIIFVPIIIIVLLTSFVFYQTSWSIISKRLTESVAADINVLVKLINSNLKAPLFLIDGLADELKKNHGNIINITDMNIEKGLPNHAIYIAAKAGLEAITKVFARDLAPAIKVNAVAPGAILEPPGIEWSEDVKKKILRKIPLNRMGNEKDIAEAVLFLINSPYITGQTINVDGGRSIG